MADELEVRRADRGDLGGILALARGALGWTDDDSSFLEWKHLENPFGESPMWVALDGDRVVGFRTFLRWEFMRPDGGVTHAARAVDTATDPAYQGRGIFTRLTLEGLEHLSSDGVELIFNTPNAKSLAGYLKMGWRELGRLAVAVSPTSVRFPLVVGTARGPAGRWPLPTDRGAAPGTAFADDDVLDGLLRSQPRPGGLTTRRSPEYMRWRYGFAPLGYRVVSRGPSLDAGVAVFRRRQRGKAIEGVLCDLLAPDGDPSAERELVRMVAREAESDYVIRVDRRVVTRGPFVRLPSVGPVLAGRTLDASEPPDFAAWSLTMGDVELF